MFAHYRNDGAAVSHVWKFENNAEQTDEGVEIDGHLIEGATLEKVESKEEYVNGGA